MTMRARETVCVILLAGAACTGNIGGRDQRGATGDDGFGTGVRAGAGRSGGSAGSGASQGGSSAAALPPELAVSGTRFPRLSHVQWENSVRDLLRLDAAPGLSSMFTPDPKAGGDFDNDVASMLVTPNLWTDYQTAAEALAKQVARDPVKLARLMPPGLPASGDARTRGFLSDLARRAYRRPASAAEIDELFALYGQGAALMGGDAAVAGSELVLRAVLQSPFFLYRIERSTAVEGDVIPLDGYEVASRLSYMLWNTMPDEPLFAAAATGELVTPAGVAKAAARLMADARGDAAIASFHRQLFRIANYVNISKNTKVFPQFTAALPDLFAQENALFVQDAVITKRGGLKELLTAPYTFVNAQTAPLYGVTGAFGKDFVRVDLDAKRRAGVLTQLGFLSFNATAAASDPIHRGVFTNLNVICSNLPPPPANVPALPPDDGVMTTRELVDHHTGAGTCGAACHGRLINPIGFAFEHFDALGAWRDTDHGKPVDSAATYPFEDDSITYADATELVGILAGREEVNRCYATKWASFALGRGVTDDDAGLIARLGQVSRAGGSVRDLLVALTQSKTFLARSTKEVTQ